MSARQEELFNSLINLIRGDVFTDPITTVAYSTDAGIYQIVPQCVICPKDTADIVQTIKFSLKHNIPVAARGAASGLAGESLCSGIVLDTARYMNRILEISPDGKTVRTEPGAVLDDVNAALARYGRKIGPDPSSGSRATIAGCLANNATGAHSLAYGHMAEHIERIELVLADASVADVANAMIPEQIDNPFLADAAGRIRTLLEDNHAVIAKALPASSRNRSGYNIAGICRNGRIDIAKLLAGSEGTLGIFSQITLATVPIPAQTAVLQIEFDAYEKMAQAVPLLVEAGACACELMDRSLLSIARRALSQYRDILPAEPVAVLWAQFCADDQPAVKSALDSALKALKNLPSGSQAIFGKSRRQRIAQARKDAVPLLYRTNKKARPIPFIEDVSVPNSCLDKYITTLEQIRRRYNVQMAYYGHAGDGELHVRPYLDLSEPADVTKMLDIANDVFSLVWSLGGSISGEHADGLVRAAFIKRQYGRAYYALLEQIKSILDPKNLLNPGKIINHDPDIMTKNLQASRLIDPSKLGADADQKAELAQQLSKCNGCGLCLGSSAGTRMCPVRRALGDELSSSRAKCTLIRAWAAGMIDEETFKSARFRQMLDLCVNCKACSLECPSGVDVSSLVTAARQMYQKDKNPAPAEFILSRNRYLSILLAKVPLAGRISKTKISGFAMEKLIGLDRRRQLPDFEKGSFVKIGNKYLASQPKIADPADKVVYFLDTFANYNDHRLAMAVVRILRHNNIEAAICPQRPMPLPAMMYGQNARARRDIQYNISMLSPYVRRGYKIICSEPSAAMALKTELTAYAEKSLAAGISQATFEFIEFLAGLAKADALMSPQKTLTEKYLYHLPCHAAAIKAGRWETYDLLHDFFGLQLRRLSPCCCGLAGTFGMQKKNYQLSMKIAAPLADQLAGAHEKTVITECAACAMQIEHISDKKVIYPAKIIAACYGL